MSHGSCSYLTCLVTVIAASIACGGDKQAISQGSGAASSSSSQGGSSPGCEAPLALQAVPGVPFDVGQQCVDTEQGQFVDVCMSTESNPIYTYYCFRRLADDQEFWLNSDRRIFPQSSGWAYCDPDQAHDEKKPPRPCFAAMCPATDEFGSPGFVESTCTFESTKTMMGCGEPDVHGVETDWDENCCRRKSCTTSRECAASEECREITPHSWVYCWMTTDPEGTFNGCDCGGFLGGPPSSYCFPSSG